MDARRNLKELLARGIDLRIPPQGQQSNLPIRHSAVLVLFGVLDQVAATRSIPVIAPDDNTASPAHRPRVPADLDVLLLRRADGMRHHPGQIAFPGGGVDPGEIDRATTALREAREETGLDPEGVEILGALPEVPIVVSNNLVTPVVGWWSRPSEIAAVDHTEAVEVFRVPVADLLDPASRGTAVVRRPPHVHRSSAFKLPDHLGGHVVWGFTGILLATLFEQLGWEESWDRSHEFPIALV